MAMGQFSKSGLVSVSDLEIRCRTFERKLLWARWQVVFSAFFLVAVIAGIVVFFLGSFPERHWYAGHWPYSPIVGPSGLFSGLELCVLMAVAAVPSLCVDESMERIRRFSARLLTAREVLTRALQLEARCGLIPESGIERIQKEGDLRGTLKEYRHKKAGPLVLFALMLLALPASYVGFLPFEEPATWGIYIFFAVTILLAELHAWIWQRRCERMRHKLALFDANASSAR